MLLIVVDHVVLVCCVSQVFHWTTFPAELFFAFKRTRDWRLFFHFLFVTIFSIIVYGVLGRKMALHTEFGDGTPITASEMNIVRKAIHRNMVFSRWEKGDILFIDNFAVSHGRQPTYDKSRKIAVAWSDPVRKTNMVKSFDSPKSVIFDEKQLTVRNVEVFCTENPQERTPEPTLTKEDSQILQKDIKVCLTLGDMLEKLHENPQDMALNISTLKSLKHLVTSAEKSLHSKSMSQPAFGPDFWKME
jgi:Taurine catabolism dioxygenase TauD, TfdA family